MLPLKGRSETAPFRECYNQVFDGLQFWNYISYDNLPFFKCLKFDEDSRNGTENREQVFRVSDNCV